MNIKRSISLGARIYSPIYTAIIAAESTWRDWMRDFMGERKISGDIGYFKLRTVRNAK